MIYFNSDYLEGAHPALMAKLNETNMVQTVGYGEDEYCAAAREKIKAACGAPEACRFFCECDNYTYGDLKKVGFARTQTLGTGGEKCDFRFYKK